MTEPRPRGGVLAVVRRETDGAFLLVRRANAPDAGLWGFPGGRIEPGEEMRIAAARELAEETGVEALGEEVLTVLESIHRDRDGTLLFHYLIAVILCRVTASPEQLNPRAGDDALEVGWFGIEQIRSLGAAASSGLLPLALQAETRA